MRRASATLAFLLLFGFTRSACCTDLPKANAMVYIRADGSIDPPTAPIITNDNVTYTLTNHMFYTTVTIERNHTNIDGNGYLLLGNGSGSGFYTLNKDNVTIKNVYIEGFTNGIFIDIDLGNTHYNKIINNTFVDNYIGVILRYSHDSTIIGNTFVGNARGIEMYSSSYASISANNMEDNGIGIMLYTCYFSSWIVGNCLARNNIGVGLEFSYNPRFYHNNFFNNTVHVSSVYSDSIWDNGYPVGGNYWSGFNATDVYSGEFQNETGSDGIADEPYVINAENQDNYPLMNPYWHFADFNHDLKVDIYDIVIICSAYGSTPQDSNWNPLCDITEPYGVIDIYDIVLECGYYGLGYGS